MKYLGKTDGMLKCIKLCECVCVCVCVCVAPTFYRLPLCLSFCLSACFPPSLSLCLSSFTIYLRSICVINIVPSLSLSLSSLCLSFTMLITTVSVFVCVRVHARDLASQRVRIMRHRNVYKSLYHLRPGSLVREPDYTHRKTSNVNTAPGC